MEVPYWDTITPPKLGSQPGSKIGVQNRGPKLGSQIGVPNWGPKLGYHNWYSYTEEVSDGTFACGFYLVKIVN
jgi:hypothetical protein